MADTISLPSMHPSDKTLKNISRIRRKSVHSLEDYHRMIIEKISSHFDKRRKQWDLDLKRKSECLSRSPSMKCPSKNTQKIGSGCKDCRRNSVKRDSTSDESSGKLNTSQNIVSRSASVKVVSSSLVTDKADKFDRLRMEIDISQYLPDGEVLFTPTKEGILVCAKYVHKGQALCEKVKVIPVDGLEDTERLRYTPTSTGAMILEVCVKKKDH